MLLVNAYRKYGKKLSTSDELFLLKDTYAVCLESPRAMLLLDKYVYNSFEKYLVIYCIEVYVLLLLYQYR